MGNVVVLELVKGEDLREVLVSFFVYDQGVVPERVQPVDVLEEHHLRVNPHASLLDQGVQFQQIPLEGGVFNIFLSQPFQIVYSEHLFDISPRFFLQMVILFPLD